MTTRLYFQRWHLLSQAREAMAHAGSVDAVLEVLRSRARRIADCDGVAVVRRRGDEVEYVGEDAISPLWAGQRFAIRTCVSGLAILSGEPIMIPDIRADDRVPLNAYLSTFVASMAVFPLGRVPIAALGLYWARVQPIARDVAALVEMLAASANLAFEEIEMRAERAHAG